MGTWEVTFGPRMISTNGREVGIGGRIEKSPKMRGKREKPRAVALALWC
jgi:hypothetical protein